MEIFDVQGLGCEEKQKVQVEVCTCEEGDTCVVALRAAQQHLSSVKVGVPAIGLLMASLALLMCELPIELVKDTANPNVHG